MPGSFDNAELHLSNCQLVAVADGPMGKSCAGFPTKHNLGSGAPKLWVALRPTGVDPPYEIFAVTADPSEGEAWTESGSDLVDVVPIPDALRTRVESFVAEHHVERPFYKRKRDRADPDAFARRAPARKERE